MLFFFFHRAQIWVILIEPDLSKPMCISVCRINNILNLTRQPLLLYIDVPVMFVYYIYSNVWALKSLGEDHRRAIWRPWRQDFVSRNFILFFLLLTSVIYDILVQIDEALTYEIYSILKFRETRGHRLTSSISKIPNNLVT